MKLSFERILNEVENRKNDLFPDLGEDDYPEEEFGPFHIPASMNTGKLSPQISMLVQPDIRKTDVAHDQNNPAFVVLNKANDLVDQLTQMEDPSSGPEPKEILNLLQKYYYFRQYQKSPEPKIEGKRGDYLASQIYDFLNGEI